jgi:hypothetical protein
MAPDRPLTGAPPAAISAQVFDGAAQKFFSTFGDGRREPAIDRFIAA